MLNVEDKNLEQAVKDVNVGFNSRKKYAKCSFCKKFLPYTEEYFEPSGDNWETLLGGCRKCIQIIRNKKQK